MIPSYRVDGPVGAPVLVLANSLGTTTAMWDDQLPELAARFRVVRFDHRGHGAAGPAPPGPYRIDELGGDLVDLLDHLGVATASLCGLSLGGMVAMWVAAHHPERVDRLVLACTAAHLPPASGWTDRAAQVRAAGTSVMVGPSLERWFTPGFAAGRPDVAARVRDMLGQADPEGYAGCCEAIAAMDQRLDLDRIRAPTLVVAGADDPATPPALGLELQAGIRGASLLVLAGAAHIANIQRPGDFGRAVVDHLAGAARDRGEAMRRRVLGQAHVERSAAGVTPLTAPWVDLITRYAWGDIWTRPALDLPTRSAMTVALLAALGRLEELPLHVAGARRNGLTDGQIGEVLLHTAVYAGVPASNAAFAVAEAVLSELDSARDEAT